VTQVGLGEDFAIALGLTLPQEKFAKIAATNNGVRNQKSNSTGGSQKANIRRIKKTSNHNSAREYSDNGESKPLR